MSKNQGGSGLKREIGIIGLLFTAIGSIIGSGWLFGALEAGEIAGPASVFSWGIGGVLIIFIGLCYAELGTMFPVSGGVIRYPHFSFGSFASYTLGWITWLAAAATTAIEVLAALQYANNYLPWLQKLDSLGEPVLTSAGLAVAIALLALFSIVNVFGIRWFSKLNNILVWWKLIVITVVIIAFFYTVFHGVHFTNKEAGGFLPYGWEGVFSAVATAGVVFSFLGFRQGVELAGETKNPKRNVPIAIIGSVLVTAILYILLQVAFIGALPLDALKNGWANIGTSFTGKFNDVAATYGPLAAIAGVIGLSWLAGLLYLDAFISPADTSLIYTTVTARLSYAMGKNGNAPNALTKVNKHGVPWFSVIVTFIAGTIFFLPFPGWSKLVGFVTSATVLSFGSGPLVLLALRKQLPEQSRPFKLPVVYIMAFLGFLATNLIIFWSGWDIVWKMMIAVLIGYIILIIHEAVNKGKTPKMQFRAGSWVVVWLIGLTVVSYLGSFPNPNKHKEELSSFNVVLLKDGQQLSDAASHGSSVLDRLAHRSIVLTNNIKGFLAGIPEGENLSKQQLQTADAFAHQAADLSQDAGVLAKDSNQLISFTGSQKAGLQLIEAVKMLSKHAKKMSKLSEALANPAGNLLVIPVGWDILVLCILSILVMWFAEKNKLSSSWVKEHIQKEIEAANDEEALMGDV